MGLRAPFTFDIPPIAIPVSFTAFCGYWKSILMAFYLYDLYTIMLSWGPSLERNGMKSLSQCHFIFIFISGRFLNPSSEKRFFISRSYLYYYNFWKCIRNNLIKEASRRNRASSYSALNSSGAWKSEFVKLSFRSWATWACCFVCTRWRSFLLI